MSERRVSYRYQEVLIETARILSPQFDDAVVFLSGAQVEMLRNVSQYLNRRNTYVSEYHPDYYLWPTDADYDDILEIAADLEETLMGNPNTLWGYKEHLTESAREVKSGDGIWTWLSTPVPAGEVHKLEFAFGRNESADVTTSQLHCVSAGVVYVLKYKATMIRWEPIDFVGQLTLHEGDQLRIRMSGCLDGQQMDGGLWGYKMKVPT